MSRRLILEQGRTDHNYWHDLWEYRELFGILAWRDVAVRYKQTVIGLAWAVIRPFLTMVVFTVIFGHVAQLQSVGNTPYALMVFAGMLPWFLTSTILGEVANSLVGNGSLLGKVYFPRLIIPGASAIVALVDFCINMVIYFGMMLWFSHYPDWRIIFLPYFVLMAVLVALGPALLLASLNVRYRDFRFIIPFLLQFGLYVSPVGFSSALIPPNWQLLYSLNPVVGVIDGFRWCLLGGEAPLEPTAQLLTIVVTILMLVAGVKYFRKTERNFADMM